MPSINRIKFKHRSNTSKKRNSGSPVHNFNYRVIFKDFS